MLGGLLKPNLFCANGKKLCKYGPMCSIELFDRFMHEIFTKVTKYKKDTINSVQIKYNYEKTLLFMMLRVSF